MTSPLVTYTEPYPLTGWVDEDPVTHTSPTPINRTSMENITDALAAMASAINYLATQAGGSGAPFFVYEASGAWHLDSPTGTAITAIPADRAARPMVAISVTGATPAFGRSATDLVFGVTA